MKAKLSREKRRNPLQKLLSVDPITRAYVSGVAGISNGADA